MRLARVLGRDPLEILEDDPARVRAQMTLLDRAHIEWVRQVNEAVAETMRRSEGAMCGAHYLIPVLESLW
jgi:hypothetical protein